MIPALISLPAPEKTKPARTNPPVYVPKDDLKPADFSPRPTTVVPPTNVPSAEMVHHSKNDDYNEERKILFLVSMMLLALVVLPMLVLTYIIFNPEAFMHDITPKYEFSSWQMGEPLKQVASPEVRS